MKTSRSLLIGMAVLSLALMLAACNGGGSGGSNGGGSVAALTVAEKVSVVDAQDPGGGGAHALLMGRFLLSDFPASSDYRSDKVSVYVNERSVEAFSTVNEILCMVAQSKYDAMLNRGAYKAQIDTNLCSSSRADASSAGQQSTNQSSGSTAPDYMSWTVESSRASDTSPQIVKAWIHDSDNGSATTIEARVVITEGASASNPYGIFTINFKAYPPGDPGAMRFRGFLKTEVINGQVLLKFASKDEGDNPGDPPRSVEKVVLQKTGGSSGAGTVYQLSNRDPQHLNQETQYNIAFNAGNFLRKDMITNGNPQVCLDRAAFEESAWRYGLYDSTTGARVTRNSGFPIKKGGNYGWVGYWGLWLPEGVTVASGETVYKHNYSDNTDVPYTVIKAGGKLKKHTRKSLTLGDIKNIPLDMFDNSSNTNYRVVWSGAAFTRTAKTSQTMNWMWQDIPNGDPERTYDLSALNWTDLFFWSQALSGQVRVKLTGCAYAPGGMGGPGAYDCTGIPVDATPVVFYAEDIVYPTDTVPASLACFDNCPNAGTSGVDTTTPFLSYAGQTPYSYTFDTTTMLLSYGGNGVVQNAPIAGFDWGIMSGPMFANTQANLDLLKCDWDNNQICGWKAWSELAVFYTWETGLNNWNRFTALSDGSGVVKFQPPLQVQYTHVQADNTKPDYKYNGTRFYLDYSGFGELHGIPGKCVNMDTGATVSCDQNTRWVPEFTIPDTQNGSLTEVTADSATYVVKALEKEQRMTGVEVSVCTGAGLATTTYSPLPEVDDPDNGWADPALDAEPDAGAPAVIGGVVQE